MITYFRKRQGNDERRPRGRGFAYGFILDVVSLLIAGLPFFALISLATLDVDKNSLNTLSQPALPEKGVCRER